MFILTIAIIVLRAAVRALLSALLSYSFVLLMCFMYIFLWTNKMMMMMMISEKLQLYNAVYKKWQFIFNDNW